jgi:hypothetical protein
MSFAATPAPDPLVDVVVIVRRTGMAALLRSQFTFGVVDGKR